MDDVAAVLKVSARSVRRYIRTGRLAAVRPGRGYRVSMEALTAFLAASTVSDPSLASHRSDDLHPMDSEGARSGVSVPRPVARKKKRRRH